MSSCWGILFLFCFSLLSCGKTVVNKDNVEKKQTSMHSSFRISLPNNLNAIRYSFIESGDADTFRNVDIDMTCRGKLSDIRVKTSVFAYTPLSKPESQNTQSVITEGCVLEMFANRLSEVDRDTCLVYDSYSPNNKINASIFFVDKNGAANYIPFRGSLCSKEKGKTKLDSVEYDLRLYLTSVKARQGLLKRTPTKKETSKVLDTLVLRKFTMDKRVSNGKTLFYPMNKIDGFENYFFRDIDSLDYYMASLVKDSVFYLRNVKGQTNEFQDMDVDGLQSFLSSLNSYERELWENDDCNDKKEQVIIWNDSTLNLASFSCASNE